MAHTHTQDKDLELTKHRGKVNWAWKSNKREARLRENFSCKRTREAGKLEKKGGKKSARKTTSSGSRN